MADTFKCPYCQKQVELSEALSHQIKEELLQETQATHAKEIQEAEAKALLKAQEKFELEQRNLHEETLENKQRNKELQEQLIELSKQLRLAQEEKENAKLEVEKRLLEESSKIREKAQEEILAQQKLKDKEKDLKIEGLMKSLVDAQRKASQGSQQTQGEALELEFEQILKQEFPNDKILEVKKGARGGDIRQEVWDRNGNMCGTILWEFKNAKDWDETWTNKLKLDQRTIKAETSILVSEILPKDLKVAGYRNGIWVTNRNQALVLVLGLRAALIQICRVKKTVDGKKEKMEIVWDYLSGVEFKHRMESLLDSFSSMQLSIEKERRYFADKWAKDEMNIRIIIDNMHGMQGELESIMNQAISNGETLKLPSTEAEEIS